MCLVRDVGDHRVAEVKVCVAREPCRVLCFLLQVHMSAKFGEMLINFRFVKFGTHICPIFRQGHAEFFYEFNIL